MEPLIDGQTKLRCAVCVKYTGFPRQYKKKDVKYLTNSFYIDYVLKLKSLYLLTYFKMNFSCFFLPSVWLPSHFYWRARPQTLTGGGARVTHPRRGVAVRLGGWGFGGDLSLSSLLQPEAQQQLQQRRAETCEGALTLHLGRCLG